MACYESATFNDNTCQWDVTGTQPSQPSLACYESATFNGNTCQWDVTGTQPTQPTLACYESATFNNNTCQWDVTGTQPPYPSGLACYQSATFNGTTCQWDVTGTANPPIVSNETQCTSFTWNVNGQTYTQSGTYTYFNNCQDYTLNLTINPVVTAGVSITSNISGALIASSSITFTATPSNGGSAPVYTWKRNGNAVGSNSATYTGTNWSTGETVQCMLTSNAPCVNGSPASSNIITLTISAPKFVLSDIKANSLFYYDSSFVYLNTLSLKALTRINSDAEDVVNTPSATFILDDNNQVVYRIISNSSTSNTSKKFKTNTGQNLGNKLKGMTIKGDSLYILDQSKRTVYRYSLTAAFNGSGTNINALQSIVLPDRVNDAEALAIDNNFVYILNNGNTKNIYRYTLSGISSATSRPLRTENGTVLSKVTGTTLDGGRMWVTDNGLDRSFSYNLSELFVGTSNLSASSVKQLNSGNLNSTGISLINSAAPAPARLDLESIQEELTSVSAERELKMNLYPNPAGLEVRLSLSGLSTESETLMMIMDITGRKLFEASLAPGAESFENVINLETFTNGTYFVVLSQGQETKSMRLVVNR